MIKYENQCCGCAAPGYPCIGDSCPYMNVPVYYCDFCDKKTHAEYILEDEHYCEFHARKQLLSYFNDLTVLDQAEVLDVSIKRLES